MKNKNGIICLILRSFSLGSGFLLFLFLAKYLKIEDFGIYGVFAITISFSVFLVGSEFYSYSIRDLLGSSFDKKAYLIRDQFVFYSFSYLVTLPVISSVFIFSVLPWSYIGWFYVLLILEHLSQEVTRLFIALGRPVIGHVILFSRCGIWVYPLIYLMFFYEDKRSLNTIFIGWLIGLFISLVIGILIVFISTNNRNTLRKIFHRRIDFSWIKKGLLIGIPFLVGALAFRGVFTFDRYILKYYYGDAVVGNYVFLIGIANSIPMLIDASVYSQYYPEIIKSAHNKNEENFKNNIKILKKKIIINSIFFSLLIYTFLPFVMNLIDKENFIKFDLIFFIMLLTVIVYSMSFVPNCILYALHMDKAIIFSNVFSFFIFLVISPFAIKNFSMIGAAVSVFLSVFIMFLIKSILIIKYEKL